MNKNCEGCPWNKPDGSQCEPPLLECPYEREEDEFTPAINQYLEVGKFWLSVLAPFLKD